MNSHNGVRMVNAIEENSKIICAQNKDKKKMECFIFTYYIEEEQVLESEITEIEESEVVIKKTIKKNNIQFSLEYGNKISFPIYENTNTECVFKESLENEYLLCCGGENSIICGRIDKDCDLIASFSLNIGRTNTQLDFIVYSSYIILFYISSFIDSDDYVYSYFYEYNIILPSCVDKLYSIIPLSSNEDYFYNLIKKEINSNYYIKFIEIPYDYINITVNGELIDIYDTEKILVDDSNQFTIISLNEDIKKNLKIKYNIYLYETFSSECFVNVNILECYRSCRTCTKSGEESDEENHNCAPKSCNDQYFLDPDIDTNCWNIDEQKSNWYLDFEQKKFLYCNDICATCDGPLDSNCLSCKTNNILKYVYNQACYEFCPDGTYPTLKSTGYACDPCYETCGTCTQLGTLSNMKCNTCK